jgi:hypothetical protein
MDNIYLARPFGKLGKAYLFDKHTYRLYRVVSWGNAAVIVAFGAFQMLAAAYHWSWLLPDSFFYLSLLLLGALGVCCLLAITSRGQVADGKTRQAITSRSNITLARFVYGCGFLTGVLFLIVLMTFIGNEIIHNKGIHWSGVLLVLVCLLAIIRSYKKLRLH